MTQRLTASYSNSLEPPPLSHLHASARYWICWCQVWEQRPTLLMPTSRLKSKMPFSTTSTFSKSSPSFYNGQLQPSRRKPPKSLPLLQEGGVEETAKGGSQKVERTRKHIGIPHRSCRRRWIS